MAGEEDLDVLLRTLSPRLVPGEFVFCTFDGASYGEHARLHPVASVAEDEGLTLVVPREDADREGLSYASAWRQITLEVHSSLDAVGLTAAFSRRLTEEGISANVIAGFFHDHVFVQTEWAEAALSALQGLARG